MRQTSMKLGVAGAFVAAFSVPTLAPAQTSESATQIEEVTVTARKREESFRDVPITVNVFTAQQIESAGIERPAEFIKLVPNMQLVETQNAGNAFVVVRGISQARNSESSVAVLVDGVLETNPAEFNQQLFDIDQIEVLKGPQGALYGRNAIGGAIIIRTRPPTDELRGQVKLGYDNGERSARFLRPEVRSLRLVLQHGRLHPELVPGWRCRSSARPVGSPALALQPDGRVLRGLSRCCFEAAHAGAVLRDSTQR
jgi:outer membrane receptor protein involved in Fe transport